MMLGDLTKECTQSTDRYKPSVNYYVLIHILFQYLLSRAHALQEALKYDFL